MVDVLFVAIVLYDIEQLAILLSNGLGRATPVLDGTLLADICSLVLRGDQRRIVGELGLVEVALVAVHPGLLSAHLLLLAVLLHECVVGLLETWVRNGSIQSWKTLMG